jgi:RNA polymerase sigma-70 factor, ECF subfamily
MPPHTPVAALPFGDVLETCRLFLLANAELPGGLLAKGGASDLVQEAMVAAHLSRDQFRGRTFGDLRAWLRAILLNELAMFRRRFTDTASRDLAREVSLAAGASLLPAADVAPMEELARREECAQLAAAVERLPETLREVVHLRVEQRLSYAAIGERLGRSEEAAQKLFTRAVSSLRKGTGKLGNPVE